MPLPVSIIICTRNRAKRLRETLRSVDQLAIPAHLTPELIVVDNGSTDSTGEILSNPPIRNMSVRSIVETQKGASLARNTALQVASGQILLWLDDDIRVPRDWLHCMTRPILDDEADALAGKVVLAPHLRRSWMRPFHRATLAATVSIGERKLRSIISANMAFSRSVLIDVLGFDPELGPGQLGTMEDVLFSWQLREAGYRIKKVTHTAVEHHFDERRLTRTAFCDAAAARGRSLSYIKYHWLHHGADHWTHRRRFYQLWRTPRIVLTKRLLDRARQRLTHSLKQTNTPITKREFWTIMNASSLSQYLTERNRPRNYKKRGLQKIRGEGPSAKDLGTRSGSR